MQDVDVRNEARNNLLRPSLPPCVLRSHASCFKRLFVRLQWCRQRDMWHCTWPWRARPWTSHAQPVVVPGAAHTSASASGGPCGGSGGGASLRCRSCCTPHLNLPHAHTHTHAHTHSRRPRPRPALALALAHAHFARHMGWAVAAHRQTEVALLLRAQANTRIEDNVRALVSSPRLSRAAALKRRLVPRLVMPPGCAACLPTLLSSPRSPFRACMLESERHTPLLYLRRHPTPTHALACSRALSRFQFKKGLLPHELVKTGPTRQARLGVGEAARALHSPLPMPNSTLHTHLPVRLWCWT